jgi:hypothetical protein
MASRRLTRRNIFQKTFSRRISFQKISPGTNKFSKISPPGRSRTQVDSARLLEVKKSFGDTESSFQYSLAISLPNSFFNENMLIPLFYNN